MTPGTDAAATDNPARTKLKRKTAKVGKKKTKELKPRKEKVHKQPLVVFAFRLTAAERDRIHKAARPGKATQLVRGAALAAANSDTKAFETLIASTKPGK